MLDSEEAVGFRVAHAVRGRTRIRVDAPERVEDVARAIEELFRDRAGVREIRVNRDCQSIVVSYDPDLLDADGLLALADETEDASWRAWLGGSLVAAGTSVTQVAEQALAGTRDSARRLGQLWSWPGNGWLPGVLKSRT